MSIQFEEAEQRKYGPYMPFMKFLIGKKENLAGVFSEKLYTFTSSFLPLRKLSHSALYLIYRGISY
jgi:hypothetical protein